MTKMAGLQPVWLWVMHRGTPWIPAIPGHLSGISNAAPQGAQTAEQQSEEPCFCEVKRIVECNKSWGHIKFCKDCDKVLKTCKEINLIKMFKSKNGR